MRISHIIGLLMAIVAVIVAFQNGEKIVPLELLLWRVKTSHGLIIIGSIISGLILGNLIPMRRK